MFILLKTCIYNDDDLLFCITCEMVSIDASLTRTDAGGAQKLQMPEFSNILL